MVAENRKIIYFVYFIIVVTFGFGIYQISEKPGIPVIFQGSERGIVVKDILDKKYNNYFNFEDVVITVNQKEIRSLEDLEFIFDSGKKGDKYLFEIQAKDSVRFSTIQTDYFYTVQYTVIALIVGLIFIIIGIFVFLQKPGDKSAVIFQWSSICVAALITTTWGSFSIEPLFSGIVVRNIFNTAYALAPVLFLHFTFVFPLQRVNDKNLLIIILYTCAIGLIIWMNITFTVAALNISIEWFNKFMSAFTSTRLFFIACIVAAFSNIFYAYHKHANIAEKKKIRWIIFGLALGISPFIVLWIIPQMIASVGLIPEEFIILFSAFIPIAFAISIVKYHIMDIDFVISRSIAYTIVMIMLLILYATILGLSVAFVGNLTTESSIYAAIFTGIILVLIFETVRGSVQKFVDRRFFRNQYNFRMSIHKLFDDIKNSLSIPLLTKIVIGRIDELIPAEKLAFVIIESETKYPKVAAHKNYEDLRNNISLFYKDEILSLNKPLTISTNVELGVNYNPIDKNILDSINASIIFPILTENNQLLGGLVLGNKKSGTRFTVEDIELLMAIVTQSGLVVERLQLQEKLICELAENKRLAELNQLKSLFVSNVSHDLKTPLTSIRMFAEILKSKSTLKSEKDKEYLEIIEGESERLTRLIDNVLDFAKLERGVKEYHFEEVDIVELLKFVLKILQYQFKVGNYKVNTNIPNKKIIHNLDPDAVKEAIINVISNAMKYSLKNRMIEIDLTEDVECTKVKIKDYGIGIAEDKVPLIFEPFKRTFDRSIRVGGTGLGLPIVKHIVDAHRGRIEVKSKLNEGSEFTLIFPKN